MKYELHPACAAWPQMPDQDIEALAADIKANGQRVPAILFDGQILDGRNRALACAQAGVELKTEFYLGADPIGFAISMNLHRRHLNESQRSMVAAKLANMKFGDNQYTRGYADLRTLSQAQAAEKLNVGFRTVSDANVVLRHGNAELIAAVEKGAIAVSLAATKFRGLGKRAAPPPPPEPEIQITLADLSPTAQQKFLALEKRIWAEAQIAIAKGIEEGVRLRVAEAIARRDAADVETIRQAQELLGHYSGRSRPPFTAGEYTNVLLRALHPDTTTPENRLEAFKLVNNKKLLLREEGRIEIRGRLPRSIEEWEAQKRVAALARKRQPVRREA